VDELIQEAKASGANVLEFGELPAGELAGGNFVRPAIVVNPDVNLRVVTREQFGPVIPIIPFENRAAHDRPPERDRWPDDAAPRVCPESAEAEARGARLRLDEDDWGPAQEPGPRRGAHTTGQLPGRCGV
jgi:hypothetical protein